MKKIKVFLFALFFAPLTLHAASDFELAARLLSAARSADIQSVQMLINAGANVNFVDNTGLSIVCTALMNNDTKAVQILQMYGADASRCDQQIKKYKKRNVSEDQGGFFSGLSWQQSMALAVGGSAAVVGGVLLFSDMFSTSSSGGGGGGGTSGGTCRPNTTCNCSDGSVGRCNASGVCDCSTVVTPEPAQTLPYGPAMTDAAAETAHYTSNLNLYSPTTPGVIKDTFTLMTDGGGAQNYLLMMHGYSPLARGYLGMRTLRNGSNAPISLAGNNLGTESVLGGRPTNVALVTSNGVNAKSGTSLADAFMPWTTTNTNGTAANGASNDMISSKYYNNTINRGVDNNSISDDTASEDLSLLNKFDLSGHNTAINNSFSSDKDNLIGKVVGGKNTGAATADFVGFMPNGQMTIYRTGGGMGMKTGAGTVEGNMTDNNSGVFGTGDVLNILSASLLVTMLSDGRNFTATDGTVGVAGYVGYDGLLYLDLDDDGTIDVAYSIEANDDLKLAKQLGAIDYYNYKALYNAGVLWSDGDVGGGRSRPDIIANASVITPLRDRGAATISDMLSFGTASRQAEFIKLINQYYDQDTTDGLGGTNALPGVEAAAFFTGLGSSFSPLVIFSTGSFETDSNYSGKTLEAGFENAAPLVFNNLEHLFMSVVAVGLTGTGTAGTTSVSGYAPSGKIALSQWHDTVSGDYYKARACGIGGKGAGSIDPWCFAAAGLTDELAVSSMAGAAGSIKSAFSYMTNKQVFALLALTADGPYLASNLNGTAMSSADLKAHLQSMYQMPTEYEYRWQTGGEDYFTVFKEVFGYGLINLERATKPTSKIYYYNGTDIVSGSGNAYWRSAVNTKFRTSAAFNPRTASISAPVYDILESEDGSLVLPRVWENEFAIGNDGRAGLFMGDVMYEFGKNKDNKQKVERDNFTFEMSVSEKQYDDNMGGLDDMRFGLKSGALEMSAGYQRNFTDGASRFNGTANPILSLASQTVDSSVVYNHGSWSFGGRGFTGAITDEALLDNDPTVSSQYQPMRMGMIQGGESSVKWQGEKFGFITSVGTASETNTILGAYTDGLLGLGNGNTTYIDSVATYNPTENISFTARATFAKTKSDPTGEFILGMSDIESNAFSFTADVGNFSFTVAQPIAATSGNLTYAAADYSVVENVDGNFDLISNTWIENVGMAPDTRETRFSGTYRTALGPVTNGAIGFVYRLYPNHIADAGNESIFMIKLDHKFGI